MQENTNDIFEIIDKEDKEIRELVYIIKNNNDDKIINDAFSQLEKKDVYWEYLSENINKIDLYHIIKMTPSPELKETAKLKLQELIN